MLKLVSEYWPALVKGLGMTLFLAGGAWAAGLVFGLPLGMAASRGPRSLLIAVRGVGFLFTALPALVILFWAHFPAQSIFNVVISPVFTTVLVLSVLNVVFVANIVSSAVLALPDELHMSCNLAALSEWHAFFKVLFPAAIRNAMPALLATQLSILHMTLFGSLISVDELFRAIQRINALEYKPIELYTIMASLFALVCVPVAVAQELTARRVGTI